MTYKYKSVLKSFQYSKENYKIISDFLLSGDRKNPDILLNVTKVSKIFGKRPVSWFELISVQNYIKSLLKIMLNSNDKKFMKTFKKFLKDEKLSEVRKSDITTNNYFLALLDNLNQKKLLKLVKLIGLVSGQKG